MHTNVQLIISGLGAGAAFALLALGLVVVFRGSGILNFAQGAVATASAYTFIWLRSQGWSLIPAIVAAILLASAIGLAFDALVLRRLRKAPVLAKVVATLGLQVALIAVIPMVYGHEYRAPAELVDRRAYALPFGSPRFIVPGDRLMFLIISAAVTLGLWALFRFTRFGRATRGLADNETAIALLGYSPQMLSMVNWALGTALAGAAGVLLSSLVQQTPTSYTLILIGAIAASLIGGLRSFGITFAACLALGAAQSVIARYGPDLTDLTTIVGWGDTLPFVVIGLVMILRGQTIPSREARLESWLPAAPRMHSPLRFFVVMLVVGIVWYSVTSQGLAVATTVSLMTGVVCLSLVVVTGYLGQISLAQMMLAGVGAFFASAAASDWGLPFPFPILVGGLLAVPVGALLALPALRVRGINLAVVTMAAAFVADASFFSDYRLSNGGRFPSAKFGPIDFGTFSQPRRYGVFVLVTLLILCVGVGMLRRSHVGVRFLAVRANERGAAALGVSNAAQKLMAFGIASFIAGIGGGLMGYQAERLTYGNFTALQSLFLVSTTYMAGIGAVGSSLIAGLLVSGGVLSHILHFEGSAGEIVQILGGIGVMLTVVLHPDGLALLPRDLREGLAARRRRHHDTARPEPALAEEALVTAPLVLAGVGGGVPFLPDAAPAGWSNVIDAPHPAPSRNGHPPRGEGLVAEALTLSYGAVHAVDQLSVRVRPGELIGLIGPNGAGKTSAIDALTGFAPSAGGVVRLDGLRIDGWSPHRRARAGLIRTFQGLEIFDDLTVLENLEVARRTSGREGGVGSTEALAMFGLLEDQSQLARSLPQGERRLLALSRALVCSPRTLVLDEPAAGLDTTESAHLGELLRAVVDRGVGILLVDHDMSLVLSVSDAVLVMDFGRLIADGVPAAVREDERVLTAYLGA